MLSKNVQHVLLFFFLFQGIACTQAFAQHYPVTITDAMGRTVTINKPIKRIAFSGTCIGEALKIMGVWDKVIGRGYVINPDKKLYPGIEDLPVFATETPGPYCVNYEKMLELDIDVLFTISYDKAGFEEMNNKIKSRVKVVALDMFVPETIENNFKILARLFDAEPQARAYLDWYDRIVKTLTDKTSALTQDEQKRYFLHWSFAPTKDFSTSTDALEGMVSTNTIIGGINVAANLKNGTWGVAVDPEWLMLQKFDVIICQGHIPHGYGTDVDEPAVIASHRKRIMALPVFASSKAVREDKVFMISSRFMFSPGVPLYMAYLAKWFYPELFPDLDPQALHQDYLNRLLHVDIDLSKHGVFAFPQ